MSSQCIDFTDTALPVWKHFSAKSGICSFFWVLDRPCKLFATTKHSANSLAWQSPHTHTYTHTHAIKQAAGVLDGNSIVEIFSFMSTSYFLHSSKLVYVHWQTTAMMGLLKALPALLKLWEEGFIYPEQLAGLELPTYVSPLENRPSWRGRQQPKQHRTDSMKDKTLWVRHIYTYEKDYIFNVQTSSYMVGVKISSLV